MHGCARWTSLVAAAVATGGIAQGQVPLTFATDALKDASVVIGGTFTADILTLRGSNPGVPLRFGNVIPRSERVEFMGQALVRGTDYQMDYEAGVLYLMRAQKAGQTVRVSYRYDKTKHVPGVQTGSSFAGLPAMQFSIVPGAFNLVLGLGMTERMADGNVLTSNLFGVNNSMGFGSSNLSGLLLLGERQKAGAASDYEYGGAPGDPGDSRSKFIKQSLSTKLGSGSIEANYQDISSNFSGFSAVRSAGYDQTALDQLQKERGLKRLSVQGKDLQFGGLKLSPGFRNVRNGDSSVDWRSLNVQSGGFKLDWSGQKVDQDFTRFADLGEADRDQLAREAGLSRENLTAEYKAAFGALSLSSNAVQDTAGQGVAKRQLTLDTSKVKFNIGEQAIDPSFTRFDSLFEAEKGQWAREIGLKRQWMAVEAALLGNSFSPLKYSQSSLRGSTGEFNAQDISLGGKSWSLAHTARSLSDGFTSLGAMAEPELDQHAAAINRMYTDTAYAPRPEDRYALSANSGVSRTHTKLSGTPFKDWNASIESLKLAGRTDGGQVDTFKITGKNANLTYRSEKIGEGFAEIAGLMELERARIGSMAGLSKTDLMAAFDFGGRKITLEQMKAATGQGSATRQMFSYADTKFQLSVAERDVTSGFVQASSLVDPEKDLLASLNGFKQRDIKAKWQLNNNFSIQTSQWEARSENIEQDRYYRNTLLNWKPDSRTNLSYLHSEQKDKDPLQVLFANVASQFSLSRDFGKLGMIEYMRLDKDFDAATSTAPDVKTDYFSYSTKLNNTTAVKTEQTRTRFENGDKEDVSSNTLSTELSKRTGVSVTDVRIDRNGDDRDEKRRNYGFWLDFGNGMRFSYGYARQLLGPSGTLQSVASLTPGTVGGIRFDGGSYTENRWDGLNTQGLANISLSSTKPFSLGFLKDIGFSMALDSATDQTNTLRENNFVKVDGRIGSNTLGAEYRSQILPTGFRAIDRTFRFATSQNENQFLRASLNYKLRQVPGVGETVIQNYKVGIRPARGLELTHELLTNPEEQFNTYVPLGSIPSPWSVNRWKLGYSDASWGLAATWEEKLNNLTLENSRLGGVTLDLFKTSGSPLQLFYGVEQFFGNVPRKTAHRYFLKFDQRPGPNQLLSVFAGNVSYEHSIADGFHRNNWTIHLDYQIRF